MLKTVKAEVDEDGTVHLLEPLHVTKRTRAIVTLLEEVSPVKENRGNVKQILEFLQTNRFKTAKAIQPKKSKRK